MGRGQGAVKLGGRCAPESEPDAEILRAMTNNIQGAPSAVRAFSPLACNQTSKISRMHALNPLPAKNGLIQITTPASTRINQAKMLRLLCPRVHIGILQRNFVFVFKKQEKDIHFEPFSLFLRRSRNLF